MKDAGTTLEALFNKMEDFVSTKTVVGETITIGEVVLLPLVEVSFGVGAVSGGIEDSKKGAGGGGLGAKITPSAVIVISAGTVQLVNVKNQDSVNKLIDMVPGVLSKLNFGPFKKEKKDDLSFNEQTYTE